MTEKGQTAAINVLNQISNQETNFDWANQNKTRQENLTNFTKKRKTAEQLIKSPKLPIILKPRNVDDLRNNHVSERKLYQYFNRDAPQSKSKYKGKPESMRLFFKQEIQPTGRQTDLYPMQTMENRESGELEIIKSWLAKKKVECKSLQIIINKFRNDSGKYKQNSNIFPFKIKSFN